LGEVSAGLARVGAAAGGGLPHPQGGGGAGPPPAPAAPALSPAGRQAPAPPFPLGVACAGARLRGERGPVVLPPSAVRPLPRTPPCCRRPSPPPRPCRRGERSGGGRAGRHASGRPRRRAGPRSSPS